MENSAKLIWILFLHSAAATGGGVVLSNMVSFTVLPQSWSMGGACDHLVPPSTLKVSSSAPRRTTKTHTSM